MLVPSITWCHLATLGRWSLFGNSYSRWLVLMPRLRFLLGRLMACDAHALDSVRALHVERPGEVRGAGRIDDLSGRGQPVEHRLVAAELDHVVLDLLPRLGRYNLQREHADHAVELELRISLLTRRPDVGQGVGALRRRDRDWPYPARLYRRPSHGIGGRVELDAVLRQVIERLRAIPIGHAHDVELVVPGERLRLHVVEGSSTRAN